jgi:hypothetical protein
VIHSIGTGIVTTTRMPRPTGTLFARGPIAGSNNGMTLNQILG